jgi:hypothetical protein
MPHYGRLYEVIVSTIGSVTVFDYLDDNGLLSYQDEGV